MRIFVKTMTGKVLTIHVSSTDTIAEVKEEIQAEEGCLPETQRLMFRGRLLEDDWTLADYSLQDETSLSLQIKMKGFRTFQECFKELGMTDEEIVETVYAKPWLKGSTAGTPLEAARVSSLPVSKRLPNFDKLCNDWLTPEETPMDMQDVKAIVQRFARNNVFRDLNLYLAADCEKGVAAECNYIKKLIFCIRKCPGFDGFVYKCLNLSEDEVEHMKGMGEFYMPGFMNAAKEGPVSRTGNTILKINTSVGKTRTLDVELTKETSGVEFEEFSSTEVLLTCYSKFKFLQEGERVDDKRVVELELQDPMEDHGDVLEWYHSIKNGKFKEAFELVEGSPQKTHLLATYQKPTSGWTALHQAAWFGNQEAVIELLAMGANKDLKSKFENSDRQGETPQEIAARRRKRIKWTV